MAGESDPFICKILCTRENNINKLEQGIDYSDLPPMYQDAITIARALNVQYVWIDSLCIIQHDKNDPLDKENGEDWKKEAERMEQVFRYAYVTIAASCASSPAEHFLKRRSERQCVTMKANNAFYYLCDVIDDFSRYVEQGELNKRGWVLQERALSRRTVYFAENQTYWECGEGVRCETLTKTKKYVIMK
jgi:Heterokaryon incompatibility protein (HET)